MMIQPLRVEGGESQFIEGSEDIDEWQQFVSEVIVGEKQSFRIELSILEPGTFWIDDVKVVKL